MRLAIASLVRDLAGLSSDDDMARALRLSGIDRRAAGKARVRLPKAVRKGRAS